MSQTTCQLIGTAAVTSTSIASGAVTSTSIASGAVLNEDVNASAGIVDSKLTGTTCKAWVNFNGTGTVAIRASYNVSSITDNGVGDYTVNFTTALADANYTPVMSISSVYSLTRIVAAQVASAAGASEIAPTTTAFRFATGYQSTTQNGLEFDPKYVSVAIFR